MRNILVGGAWPYANGSLHIGHIAGLLPGDVLARYHRAVGDNVVFVSGSDCHGTPVAIRAKQENERCTAWGKACCKKSPGRSVIFTMRNLKSAFKGWDLAMMYIQRHPLMNTRIL